MKVIVNDNEVKIIIDGETLVTNIDNIVKIFKEAKDGLERNRLAIKYCTTNYFRAVSEEPKKSKKLSTLDILEGCVHVARKCSFDYDLENEIDELLGTDGYTPLY